MHMEGKAVFWTVICSAVQLITAQVSVLPNPLTGVTGQNLTISCIVPADTYGVRLFVGNTSNSMTSPLEKYLGHSIIHGTFVTIHYFYGPLEDSDRGLSFQCSNIGERGEDTVNLTLLDPPEFSACVELVTSTQFSSGSSFTFNCTPSAANPAASFSFMKDGSTYTEPAGNINGPVLTISSVVRTDTGNYSCTATNTAGSTTLYSNLLVVDTPAPANFITIIIAIAVTVVVVLVLIFAIICIICCKRIQKNKSGSDDVEGKHRELAANRNVVTLVKYRLTGDRTTPFMETALYEEVGNKETIKSPKPQSTPASTTNGQPQPGGDVYAEVNKPKKARKASAPPAPPAEDMYAAVDMSKKTNKTKIEADQNELQYADLDFSKAPSSFKKPAPPKPDGTVIYSDVIVPKEQ